MEEVFLVTREVFARRRYGFLLFFSCPCRYTSIFLARSSFSSSQGLPPNWEGGVCKFGPLVGVVFFFPSHPPLLPQLIFFSFYALTVRDKPQNYDFARTNIFCLIQVPPGECPSIVDVSPQVFLPRARRGFFPRFSQSGTFFPFPSPLRAIFLRSSQLYSIHYLNCLENIPGRFLFSK